MNKEIESLLIEAQLYRNSKRYDKALSNLHKLIEECPKNLNYRYLLAATYFETINIEASKEYAEQILEKDPKYKEALELLGTIAIREKQYSKAETYLNEAISIDQDFYSARQSLIELYDKYLPDDNLLEYHCKYMLQHRDKERDKLSVKKIKEIRFNWLVYVTYALIRALARQHKFEEAINLLREYLNEYKVIQKRYNPLENISQYGDLYKFYYLNGDKKELEKFKEEFRQTFPGKTEKEYEDFFERHEKWAIERYP